MWTAPSQAALSEETSSCSHLLSSCSGSLRLKSLTGAWHTTLYKWLTATRAQLAPSTNHHSLCYHATNSCLNSSTTVPLDACCVCGQMCTDTQTGCMCILDYTCTVFEAMGERGWGYTHIHPWIYIKTLARATKRHMQHLSGFKCQ